jgi:hypothetical protein
MENGTIVFSNERYEVTVGDFTSPVRSNGCEFTRGYVVTNKVTGVVEFQVPQYPESIAAAEQLDIALETKPWEWVRKQQVPQEVNPDGSPKGDPEETVH